ncbi:hypothetical protein ACFLW5_02570 [Chloroflexota bacterium]
MIKRIATLVIIFILGLAAPALAAEPSDGIIEGRIVNGTTNTNVVNQSLTLRTYLNDTETDSISGTTDVEGQFVFEGLSTGLADGYQLVFTFQEAEYYSEWLSFNEGEITKSIEVTVYDSTSSDETISVTTAHTVIYVEQDNLRVQEVFLFANKSDHTYIGSGEITATGTRRTLIFPLPDKATGLQYGGELMDCCVLISEDGFTDTMPVLPGEHEIVFGYSVEYNSGKYEFSQRITYPTANYNMLVQGGTIESAGNQLTVQAPLVMGDVQFHYLSGENLAPGDTLVIQLSGLPGTNSQSTIQWTVLTLVILASGFAFAYQMRKRKLQPVRAASPEGSPGQSRQGLLADLAQIDDDFEDGKIPEEAYRSLRAEKKAQLVELVQRSENENGNRQ